jgi:hypothetical protein
MALIIREVGLPGCASSPSFAAGSVSSFESGSMEKSAGRGLGACLMDSVMDIGRWPSCGVEVMEDNVSGIEVYPFAEEGSAS